MRSLYFAGALLMVVALDVRAQEPDSTLPQVAELMKPFLVKAIPPVLYEHSRDWGRTTRVPLRRWSGRLPRANASRSPSTGWCSAAGVYSQEMPFKRLGYMAKTVFDPAVFRKP